jgi:hypothetical protein
MKISLLIALLGLASSFTSCATGDHGTSNWTPANGEGIGSDYDSVYQATGVRPGRFHERLACPCCCGTRIHQGFPLWSLARSPRVHSIGKTPVEDNSTSLPPSARLLSHYFVYILILPDPKKDRLARSIISRPFREFYLADHHRLDPVATPHFGSGQSLVPPVASSHR